ncbi:MAG: MATE family efflux transporter [Opitutae bacterium]|nr:MATE family efflux transporter [Opitutae bacterium]
MDLTKDPIPGLVRKIAVPASIGFFFNTMYNVVDTFFAGFISTDALAALSISFPVFFIIIAMGSGISQGGTALIANALGEKDQAKAHHTCVQCLSFGAFFAVALTALGLLSAPMLFQILGASGEYLEIALDYINLILCGTLFIVIQSIANACLNAQGDTKTYRNVLIASFFLNCVLDPWFMYGGLGIPSMGIKGIALATIMIQFLGMLYVLHRLSRTKLWEGPILSMLAPSVTYREIARQGFPASFNMVSVAVGIFIITLFISKFSTESVAAYGIATRIEQIIILPTIGLNIAVLSMTGQNNGAKKPERIRETLVTTMKYGLIMMAAGGLLLFFAAETMMRFFSEDSTVIQHGTDYLEIASITLCSYVILFQTVNLLQGLKKPFYGLVIGVYRQVLAPCIVFYLLAFKMDMQESGVWWGIFLVTWSAAIISYFYGRNILRRRLSSAAECNEP